MPRGPGMGPGVDRPVPGGGGVASDHGRDLLGLPGEDGVGAGPHQRAVGREGVAAESRVLPGPSDGRNGGHRGVPEEVAGAGIAPLVLRARQGGPEDQSGYQTPTALAGAYGGVPPGGGPRERRADDGLGGLHPGQPQGGEPGRGGAHRGGGHGLGEPSEGTLLPGYGNGCVTGRQDTGLRGEGQPPGHDGVSQGEGGGCGAAVRQADQHLPGGAFHGGWPYGAGGPGGPCGGAATMNPWIGGWTPGETVRTVELPALGEVKEGELGSLVVGDWLMLISLVMKDLTVSSGAWWDQVLAVAAEAYPQWLQADPLQRLHIRPRAVEDDGGRWSRVAQRA